ncbi:phosphoenolpyruvate carboxylase [uncultured Nocardioides sp.]|uniref:phosphoenolpyruvate carboxylase n=1 Tax=uncultured Nocardioides sp. TaxID=198441 RepID=UPI0025D26740|nr:phosphoenolpyruvate carboxylase [uncultured Nocardioides sp.]
MNSSEDREASRATDTFEVPPRLRADVRLLGETLGTVIREQAGESVYADVERLRELTIAACSGDTASSGGSAERAEKLIAGWPWEHAVVVARAFACYFHLTNLAEEHDRARSLSAFDAARRPSAIGAAYQEARESDAEEAARLLAAFEIHPVLTAHPTEARRRAVVAASQRIAELLVERDRIESGVEESFHRRLTEAVDRLWRTAIRRTSRPTPLDEVRTFMTVFDETLFGVAPEVYRRVEAAVAGDRSGLEPTGVPAFLRLGSWVGGDRDGNPSVTADVTREAMAIQSEHVLRALERACSRVGRALTLDERFTPPSRAVTVALARATTEHPQLMKQIATRSPGEPHRQLMLLAAERIAATRTRDADRAYASPAELRDELVRVQESLIEAGAHRQAHGDLQHLLWQLDTFGFHLAELEIRQHSEVHAEALAQIEAGGELSARTVEVLDTLSSMAQLQRRYGERACRRYVVSFTRSAADVAAVYELARVALDGAGVALDVVPLFETEQDLEASAAVVAEIFDLPEVQQRLAATGGPFEVMLGYSDSAKDVGPVAATLALHRAQARLVAWAESVGVRLTLFHGRGGALGRGGGPAHRAVLGQAAGSVAGKLKLTEQGEVVFARYGNRAIATRHLEQVGAAIITASTRSFVSSAGATAEQYDDLARRLGSAAKAAYRELVEIDGFPEWFAQVTPLAEIERLRLGSRPARRQAGAVSRLSDLRAIPWVFAWSQARVNLPGWFGLGTALRAEPTPALLREARDHWPLFRVLLDNAEMSLAKADPRLMRRFLELGGRDDLTERVVAEYERTTAAVLEVTEQDRLLERRPVLRQGVDLRGPYVDALSYLGLRALRELRSSDLGAPRVDERLPERLLQLSVSGVAAGLQNTG